MSPNDSIYVQAKNWADTFKDLLLKINLLREGVLVNNYENPMFDKYLDSANELFPRVADVHTRMQPRSWLC